MSGLSVQWAAAHGVPGCIASKATLRDYTIAKGSDCARPWRLRFRAFGVYDDSIILGQVESESFATLEDAKAHADTLEARIRRVSEQLKSDKRETLTIEVARADVLRPQSGDAPSAVALLDWGWSAGGHGANHMVARARKDYVIQTKGVENADIKWALSFRNHKRVNGDIVKGEVSCITFDSLADAKLYAGMEHANLLRDIAMCSPGDDGIDFVIAKPLERDQEAPVVLQETSDNGGADVLASSDVDDIILRMFDSLQKDKAKLRAECHAVVANRDKLVKLLFCLRDRETIIADLKNARELFAETALAVAMYDEVPKKLLELMGWAEHGVGDEGKS